MPSKNPPLQIDVNHPDKDNARIKFNSKYVSDFAEVDVLGCVGVRHARDGHGYFVFDADGCPFMEKVHGHFVIEWKPEPEPEETLHEDYGNFWAIGMPPDGCF